MSDSTAAAAAFPACFADPKQPSARASRSEEVACLSRANSDLSQRQQAKQWGISRGRLRHWRQRQKSTKAPAEEVAFFESPQGLALLHRILVASHMVITLKGCGGVRQVCEFLEWSGLSAHVASSYYSQHQLSSQLEQAVVAFGEQQRKKLSQNMPTRQITVTEDETYHPSPCLVSLEPVSGFIPLEQYANDRSAETWTQALKQATLDMPLEVIQVTSDQAKGLCRHARDLNAHQSPDLFHVQHDLVKASGLTLKRAEQRAEEAVAKANEELAQEKQAQALYLLGSSRSPHATQAFARRVEEAQIHLASVQEAQEQARRNRQQARDEIKAIGQAYHPYHLETGEAQTTEQLKARLDASMARLEKLTETVGLSERCRQLLSKAQGMRQALLLTLQFFILTCTAKVEALNLPLELEVLMQRNLILSDLFGSGGGSL